MLFLILVSCSDKPGEIFTPEPEPDAEAVYILCEGLWGMDNASLTRFEQKTENVIEDYYSYSNPGYKLGDIANDMVIRDSLAIIAVSTSKRIEIINLKTGKIYGRIELQDDGSPRKIAVVNDSLAYITRQNGNNISLINFRKPSIINESIPAGASPEGIAYFNGRLYVANSGFGDYNQNAPKASTISVIDIYSNTEINNIKTASNPMEVLVSEGLNRLYVAYNNLPSLVIKYDSSGEIIEYSLPEMTEKRHWKCDPRSMQLTHSGDSLYFIDKNQKICMIDLQANNSKINYLLTSSNVYENWYSLAISSQDNSFWIGNARNYQSKGTISVYSMTDSISLIRTIPCGVNPNKIILK